MGRTRKSVDYGAERRDSGTPAWLKGSKPKSQPPVERESDEENADPRSRHGGGSKSWGSAKPKKAAPQGPQHAGRSVKAARVDSDESQSEQDSDDDAPRRGSKGSGAKRNNGVGRAPGGTSQPNGPRAPAAGARKLPRAPGTSLGTRQATSTTTADTDSQGVHDASRNAGGKRGRADAATPGTGGSEPPVSKKTRAGGKGRAAVEGTRVLSPRPSLAPSGARHVMSLDELGAKQAAEALHAKAAAARPRKSHAEKHAGGDAGDAAPPDHAAKPGPIEALPEPMPPRQQPAALPSTQPAMPAVKAGTSTGGGSGGGQLATPAAELLPEEAALLRPLDPAPARHNNRSQDFLQLQRQYYRLQQLYMAVKEQKVMQLEGLLAEEESATKVQHEALARQVSLLQQEAAARATEGADATAAAERLANAQEEILELRLQLAARDEAAAALEAELRHLRALLEAGKGSSGEAAPAHPSTASGAAAAEGEGPPATTTPLAGPGSGVPTTGTMAGDIAPCTASAGVQCPSPVSPAPPSPGVGCQFPTPAPPQRPASPPGVACQVPSSAALPASGSLQGLPALAGTMDVPQVSAPPRSGSALACMPSPTWAGGSRLTELDGRALREPVPEQRSCNDDAHEKQPAVVGSPHHASVATAALMGGGLAAAAAALAVTPAALVKPLSGALAGAMAGPAQHQLAAVEVAAENDSPVDGLRVAPPAAAVVTQPMALAAKRAIAAPPPHIRRQSALHATAPPVVVVDLDPTSALKPQAPTRLAVAALPAQGGRATTESTPSLVVTAGGSEARASCAHPPLPCAAAALPAPGPPARGSSSVLQDAPRHPEGGSESVLGPGPPGLALPSGQLNLPGMVAGLPVAGPPGRGPLHPSPQFSLQGSTSGLVSGQLAPGGGPAAVALPVASPTRPVSPRPASTTIPAGTTAGAAAAAVTPRPPARPAMEENDLSPRPGRSSPAPLGALQGPVQRAVSSTPMRAQLMLLGMVAEKEGPNSLCFTHVASGLKFSVSVPGSPAREGDASLEELMGLLEADGLPSAALEYTLQDAGAIALPEHLQGSFVFAEAQRERLVEQLLHAVSAARISQS